MAGPVAHEVEGVGRLAHRGQDRGDDLPVAALVAGADQVRLAAAAAVEDEVHRRVVVIDVGPLTDVDSLAVKLGPNAGQDVRDLARDQLLDVLVGAVVVGAVR
jgi:hypothetical protein